MNKNQAEGKFDKAKGTVQEKFGEATNDPEDQLKGKAEQLKGKAKDAFGDLKEGVKNIGKKDQDQQDVNP